MYFDERPKSFNGNSNYSSVNVLNFLYSFRKSLPFSVILKELGEDSLIVKLNLNNISMYLLEERVSRLALDESVVLLQGVSSNISNKFASTSKNPLLRVKTMLQ